MRRIAREALVLLGAAGNLFIPWKVQLDTYVRIRNAHGVTQVRTYYSNHFWISWTGFTT